ncbi:hypothetical protein EYV94_11660 [Puteibacter caeruleilacunae]|nr:hypothetical protein EYV94_11660 [Puteibacter caeruleilacunae]
MNGYERIKAALNGQPTDTTPIMLHNFMMAAREAGVSMNQYRNDPQIIADVFKKAIDTYQYDGILVDIDTVTLAGALGVPVDFPESEPARSHEGLISSIEEVNQLKPVLIKDYRYIDIWLEAVRKLKEYFKDDVFIRGNCDQAPFSLASMIRGTQDWLMNLYMTQDTTLLHQLLEYCTEATTQFINLMAETGCDMVSNGDSPAGPDMVPPEIYETYALPYEQKVIDAAHANNLPYTLHICGNTDLILERMVKSGADAFELDYKTDINAIKSVCKDRITFIGNIDPSGIIAMGTPQQVEEKTIQLLEAFADSNRFILNAGCAIPTSTPGENLKTMIDCARNF